MKRVLIAGLLIMVGIVPGIVVGKGLSNIKIAKIEELADKHLELFLMVNQWVKIKQENKSIAKYLKKKGYKQVAIYGMNYIGATLVDELAGKEIDVKYGIDKKADSICSNIEIFYPKDNLEDVDVIIVTAVTSFDEIEEDLSKKVNCQILSLEDILYEM